MISIDVGYGNIKASDGERLWAFPAIYTPVPLRHLPMSGDSAQLLDLGEDGRYFVGWYALELGGEAPFNKTDIFRHKLFTLAAICEGTTGDWKGEVSLGLPIGDFDLMQKPLQSLIGEYAVTYNGTPRNITITNIQVNAQAGAVFKSLAQKDPSLKRKIVGIVDIGQKTVDVAYFQNGAFLFNKSTSFEGISTITAYKKIAEAIGLRCEFFVEDFAVRPYLDDPRIKEDVDKAFAEMARGILNRLARLGWDFRQMNTIALVGGGASYVQDAFTKAGAQIMPLSEEDAVFANAKSFLL